MLIRVVKINKKLKFRICHLASVPEGGKLCITAGGASVANGTCGLEYGKSIGVLEEGERNRRAFCTKVRPLRGRFYNPALYPQVPFGHLL